VLEISERALLCVNPELLDETWTTQRGRSHFRSLRAAHRILKHREHDAINKRGHAQCSRHSSGGDNFLEPRQAVNLV
jgi:hypothetical protein